MLEKAVAEALEGRPDYRALGAELRPPEAFFGRAFDRDPL